MRLTGKTALVTGASRGLGLQIAIALAHEGADLALLARDPAALKEAAARAREAGEPGGARVVNAYPCDLADDHQFVGAFEAAARDLGGVDVLVNNAAVQGPIGPFATVDFAAWRAVFDTDFFAPARLCKLALPGMLERNWGRIINLSGGGATSPRPHVSAYGASKCALVRFSETLAEELGGSGVTVNCVAPGAMNTRMLDEVLEAGPNGAPREYQEALARAASGGAPPGGAADLVAFLASPAGDGITGRLISAVWDRWQNLGEWSQELSGTDVYTLRRVVPKDRGIDR